MNDGGGARGRGRAQTPPRGAAEGRRGFPSARRTGSGARRSSSAPGSGPRPLRLLLRRYAPLDLAATLSALLLAACLPSGAGGALAVALPCAALESLVFYSLAFLRERRAGPGGRRSRRRVLARLLREYAAAEAVDLWARPTAMAIALGSLPHPLLAVLAGSLGADALFYLTAARSWGARAVRASRAPSDRCERAAGACLPAGARVLPASRE